VAVTTSSEAFQKQSQGASAPFFLHGRPFDPWLLVCHWFRLFAHYLSLIMFLNDKAINALAELDILMPFVGEKRRYVNGIKAVSYGLSQCGYDIRLSPVQFSIFDDQQALPIDKTLCPKENSVRSYDATLYSDDLGDYFELPPRSVGNGISLERFSMPNDIGAIVKGKSTYARLGLIANITPVEPGWSGYLTMNFINTTDFPIRLFANEGIAQVMFFRCGEVEKPYEGHYQNQSAKVHLAAV
jgi:dCTP deaminase